jgi:hypothetical protein
MDLHCRNLGTLKPLQCGFDLTTSIFSTSELGISKWSTSIWTASCVMVSVTYHNHIKKFVNVVLHQWKVYIIKNYKIKFESHRFSIDDKSVII